MPSGALRTSRLDRWEKGRKEGRRLAHVQKEKVPPKCSAGQGLLSLAVITQAPTRSAQVDTIPTRAERLPILPDSLGMAYTG
jgi:hypothetical protein